MTPADYPASPEPLRAVTTDSHCHLDIERDGQRLSVPAALAAAAAVGVRRIVQIGCDLEGAAWAVRTAHEHPAVVAGVALHPNEAPRLHARGQLVRALDEIESLAGDERVRAVGETGLDYFRTGDGGRAVQEESFRWHIDLARRLDKALVIHDRDAHADVLRILGSCDLPDSVVFHCFSGDADMATHCVERGWYLSFAGTVTFENAQAVRAAVAVTPLDNMLVETDAPYLTPVPFRGRNNASYLIPLTLREIARIKDVDVDDVTRATQRNSTRVFRDWDEHSGPDELANTV
jgi:TatD DNase family protein